MKKIVVLPYTNTNMLINVFVKVLTWPMNSGVNLAKAKKYTFFDNRFTYKESDLTNYFTRTDLKDMIITLRHPDLNEQIHH